LVDFIDEDAGLAAAFAGALVAAGFVSAVFWRRGFLVALAAGFAAGFMAAGFAAGFAAGLAAGLAAAVFAAGLAAGAGLAAIAGAVIRNAAARSDARVFFISVHLLP
jgi:hypothetical protein